MQKAHFNLLLAITTLATVYSCNKSDYNYFPVSQNLTKYGVVKATSWYKFKDSLGTEIDTVKVTSVANTFLPIAGQGEDNLYQTITIKFTHTLSKKESKLVLIRDTEKSTMTYTNTLGEATTILTDPIEAGTTISRMDSIKSGKDWYKDIIVVSEANKPSNTLYIANGKWVVKKIDTSTPEQKWILDAIVVR